MSRKYPLSFLERRWAERIQSPEQIRGQIAVAIERTLQLIFDNEGLLIPISVRTVVGRRLRPYRSYD